MKYVSLVLGLIGTLMLAPPAIHATPITYVAKLTGANEVPPTGSPGSGLATVVLDTALNTMHVDIVFSGLLGVTTASHIHCCLPSAFLTGVNVGVATTTPTFPGFPLGVSAGEYHHDFDLGLASSYNPAFITAQGGLAAAEAALENGIGDGRTYLNVHTDLFPGGEIRGFVVAAPEPASLVLLGSALFGLGLMRRRKLVARSSAADVGD